jgi:hypothetical protein
MKTRRTRSAQIAVRLAPTILFVLAALLLAAASASAAAPGFLTKSPEDGKPGAGAGQMVSVEGIAAAPQLPGHVYVADGRNERIDELTAWGGFVKAWGWGVRNGEAKLQSCTTECRQGLKGAGSGQLNNPEAVAVDSEGNVYVLEAENHRVQKFDPGAEGEEAKFLLAFGSAGVGPGQFGAGKFGYTNRIAANGKTLFVGEGERIQVFDSGGTLKEEIEGGDLAGRKIRGLASDGAGKLYAAFEGQAEVHKLEAKGPGKFMAPQFKPELPAEVPIGLALDGAGDLYVVVVGKTGEEPARVQEYDKEGNCLTCGAGGEGGKPGFDRSPGSQLEGVAASAACGADDAYVLHFSPLQPEQSFVSAFGPPPNTATCPQPQAPPLVNAQYALAVESHSAELGADINPKFWEDTSYHVEYGSGECRAGGCPFQTTGAQLTSRVTSTPLATGGVVLKGLEPGITYHYRFVAESGGGGPVWGVDPDGPQGPRAASFAEGLEGSFTTYREAGAEPCPANEAFRGGASALLPDCRAYEMVSPLDKDGGDITVFGSTPTLLPATIDQASLDGGKLAYGSSRAFGDAQSAPWTSQYVAKREVGVGWVSHAVSPPRGKALGGIFEQAISEFKAFSADLCEGWVQSVAEPPLASGAPAGIIDLYRRGDEECGGSSYQALNTAEVDEGLHMELQGVSEDGKTAVFKADRPLAAGGSAGQTQLYGAEGREERLLCILPGGGETAWAGSCTAGQSAPQSLLDSQEARVQNALSGDGSRVYWTASASGPGRIYLRENPFGEGGECGEASAPCTLDVSRVAEEEAKTSGSAFWAAAKDGSKAIFTTGGKLYEYRPADGSTHLIAGEVVGVMGASEDATRVYFASREAIAGSGKDALGEETLSGQINLYFHEAGEPGSLRFIGPLAEQDLNAPSPIADNPDDLVARVSPDGESAAFSSFARLTGYDNTDRNSGEADAELFVYDARARAGEGKLVCASCNPSGARPAGRQFKRAVVELRGSWTAARIPVPENVLYASRVLSDNGRRLFFDSYDSLSPHDTDGRQDVYEWEAPGEGRCNESSPTYSPTNGGCVDLISTGKSTADSEFLDADPSGNDVFFTTVSSLLPQDSGSKDVYDARVDGGLPGPPTPPVACEGEACQGPYNPTADPTPASSSFQGTGNVHEPTAIHKPITKKKHAKKKQQKRCAKGKGRLHGKCVKQHHDDKQKRHQRANQNRRAAR